MPEHALILIKMFKVPSISEHYYVAYDCKNVDAVTVPIICKSSENALYLYQISVLKILSGHHFDTKNTKGHASIENVHGVME